MSTIGLQCRVVQHASRLFRSFKPNDKLATMTETAHANKSGHVKVPMESAKNKVLSRSFSSNGMRHYPKAQNHPEKKWQHFDYLNKNQRKPRICRFRVMKGCDIFANGQASSYRTIGPDLTPLT